MPQIAYILPYLESGGTETHVIELIKGLGKEYQTALFAPPGSRLTEFKELAIRFIPFTSLDKNPFRGLREFHKKLHDIAKDVDLIHVHAAHELVLFTRLFLGRSDIPIFFTVHGYEKPFDYRLSSIFSNLFADEVIVVSAHEYRKMLNNGMKRRKLNLIYNGISLPERYSTDNLPSPMVELAGPGKKVIGTVARLDKNKGIHILLEAFHLLAEQGTHLLIIGEGELEEKLKQMAGKLRIADRIKFAGFVANTHDYYEAMDVFVLPTIGVEASGLAVMEAMAHGLPVISTEVGGIPELVRDGETGLLVPPGDAAALKGALERLVGDAGLAERLGKAGRQRYEQEFSAEVMVERVRELYEGYLQKD
ncbi:MAG: glycosyltransferase family 4 protein [Halanaerobium sp.]|nr:glycosyltransferase family 4 protein [Halanaerobium sp.]